MNASNVTRRDVLRALAGLGLGAVAEPLAPSSALADATAPVGQRCFRAFREALRDRPWVGAFRSVDADQLPLVSMTLSGRVPEGFEGTLYRNGPTGLERNGVRYQHWFDGDGMVQAYRVGRDGIQHFARKVQTAKYLAEKEAGRFLFGGAGSRVPKPQRSRDNDATNPANISVVPYEDRLLALWEAGSAHALDPKTLATQSAVTWSPETERMPFSAHPVVDADGSLWNFGAAQWAGPSGVLILYRIQPGQGLTRVAQVPLPFPGYVHSFAATATKLVLYLSPNVFDREARGDYISAHRWRPELGGRVLIVDKNDFSRYRWVEAPAGFVFHIVGATDEPDGSISFRASWYFTADLMNGEMSRYMWGQGEFVPARLTTVRVPKSGSAKTDTHDLVGEFPVVDPRIKIGGGHRVFMGCRSGRSPWMNAVGGCDTRTGRTDVFSFGADTLVEEHLFVPRDGVSNQHAGWLVGTHFDVKKQQTGLAIFDAERISEGPLVRASMGRAVPLGFHGWFWPRKSRT